MQVLDVPPEVRTKLGPDATEGLVKMLTQCHDLATASFERRLTEEASGLRLEFERGFGSLRVEMERMRSDVIRWNLLFWIGQFAALTTVMALLLNGR